MIGLSSSVYAMKGFNIYGSIEKIRELGFELAEIGAAHKYEKNAFTIIKKVVKDFGDLQFTVHAYFPPFKMGEMVNFSLGLTRINKKVIDNLFKTAEMTEALAIGFHPGFTYKKLVFMDGKIKGKENYASARGFRSFDCEGSIDKKEAIKKNYKVIEYIIKKNRDLNIRLCFENLPVAVKPAFYTLEDFQQLFEKYENIYFLYDVGHAMQSFKDGYMYLKLKNRIKLMHLHDYDGKRDHLILGKGKIDLKRILSLENIKHVQIIFEHGNDATDEELIKEKKLVEKYL